MFFNTCCGYCISLISYTRWFKYINCYTEWLQERIKRKFQDMIEETVDDPIFLLNQLLASEHDKAWKEINPGVPEEGVCVSLMMTKWEMDKLGELARKKRGFALNKDANKQTTPNQPNHTSVQPPPLHLAQSNSYAFINLTTRPEKDEK